MLRNKKTISLELADKISAAAISACLSSSFPPITVVVVDCDANPVVSKRMDGCPSVGIPQFALAKASSCITLKVSTREIRDKYTAGLDLSKIIVPLAMNTISSSHITPFPGGVLLKHDGVIIGAIGVSGASSDEDEYCALKGVEELNNILTSLQNV
eukprot:gene17656-23243_t